MTVRVSADAAWKRYLLCALATLTLTACEPFGRPDTMMEEYIKRLGNVLEVEPHVSPLPAAPVLPRLRDRTVAVELHTLGMLDFLSLYGCDLQHVVSGRNSTLGKVMHPSSRLMYELRFIESADACLESIEREVLAERIEQVTAAKRDSLADVVWNAVWGSREIERLLSRSDGPLPVRLDRNRVSEMTQLMQELVDALEAILSGDLDSDLSSMDRNQQRWLGDSLPGQLILSAVLMSTRLNDASAMLEQRLGSRPLCLQGRSNRQAEVMRNMMVSVYAAHVQVYLADVQHVRRLILPLIQRMLEVRETLPGETFRAFMQTALDEQHPDGVWAEFDASVIRHAGAWQALLDQCGLVPGNSVSAVFPGMPQPQYVDDGTLKFVAKLELSD